jgi:hypothetical protein
VTSRRETIPLTHRGRSTLLVVLTSLGLVAPALGGPVVRRASGEDASSIQAIVEQFRADLGGPDNGEAVGPLASGRREITRDAVEDFFASPGFLPGHYFNSVSKRGALLSASPGCVSSVALRRCGLGLTRAARSTWLPWTTSSTASPRRRQGRPASIRRSRTGSPRRRLMAPVRRAGARRCSPAGRQDRGRRHITL